MIPTRKEIKLRAVRPSAAVGANYRDKLLRLVDQMTSSVRFWIERAYKADPPLAQDDVVRRPFQPPRIDVTEVKVGPDKVRFKVAVDGEPLLRKTGGSRLFLTRDAAYRAAKIELGLYLPAEELNAAVDDMADLWQSRFDALAPKLAEHFAKSAKRRSDGALAKALKDGGMSVEFQVTPAMADVMAATVKANVELIRSIPQKYMGGVQGAVMRSVQQGRDLGSLASYLEDQVGVTKRRAAGIAIDQNNKATSAMQKARQTELNIEEAVWRHSQGGKHPRPKHLAANGTRYKVSEGLPIGDEGQNVWPGEEIHCRCVSISIVPGFEIAPVVPNPKKGSAGAERWARRF